MKRVVLQTLIVIGALGLLAGFLIPGFSGAKAANEKKYTQWKTCNKQLEEINLLRERWIEKVGTTPTLDQLYHEKYGAPSTNLPVCPSGGTYSVDSLNKRVSCSLPDHRTE